MSLLFESFEKDRRRSQFNARSLAVAGGPLQRRRLPVRSYSHLRQMAGFGWPVLLSVS